MALDYTAFCAAATYSNAPSALINALFTSFLTIRAQRFI